MSCRGWRRCRPPAERWCHMPGHIGEDLRVFQIVERGAHDPLWQQPEHPYTRSLIAAVPRARR
ncbi:MAG: hypothetical protein JNM97_07925 [Rhodoferax sp.]|nr:hypothetical protein [Rhodoferax sp.]